jgi:ADP-heptose:LPS heptosyltransferase
VREKYPDAELYFLTVEDNRGIFELFGGLVKPENVFCIRIGPGGRLVRDVLRALREVRRAGIDIVFDLEFFSRFSAVLSYFTGAARRVGFARYAFEGLYRGDLLTHRFLYNPLIHVSRAYLSLGQAMEESERTAPASRETAGGRDFSLPRYVSRLEPRESLERSLEELGVRKGARLFLLNPGEGELPLREWSVENFDRLIRLILEDERSCVVLVGVRKDAAKVRALCRAVDDARCIDLTGRTTLPELMELFTIGEALIANDGGLAHLASFTPIRKVVLFGPESPRVFGPLGENVAVISSGLSCSPCFSVLNHRKSCCRDNRCLKVITPQAVYEALRGPRGPFEQAFNLPVDKG